MGDFQSYIPLFLIIALSTILIRSILLRKQNKTLLPPSPQALPIIGHLHLISSLPHHDFQNLSIRYGPIMHLFFGSIPCVVASTAEAAKEFLKTHETSFSNRPAHSVAIETISYGFQDFLFAPYGPYFKFMKKLCVSELLGGRILDQLQYVRKEETTRLVKVVLKKSVASEIVDLGGEFMTLVNNIVSRMMLSQRSYGDESEVEGVRKLVADTAEVVGKLNISDFIWFLKSFDLQGLNKRLKGIMDRFDTMLDRVIKEHEEERRNDKEMGRSHQIKDILDVLLDIYENESSEFKLTKDNIKAFIVNVFVAGTDTPAVTMEWAMSELINNPHAMEKARQEIDAVIGKNRIVEEEDIVNLPYLQAIIKETFRLHPAAPLVPRESSKRDMVRGYEIPTKTRLFVNIWAIGRDPKIWESPLEFKPERFIEGNELSQLDVTGQHYQLIPFGSGRRGCPGRSLALPIVHVNLATMIHCFEWKVDDGREKVDMEEKPGLTVRRAHPIIYAPVPRLHPFPSI